MFVVKVGYNMRIASNLTILGSEEPCTVDYLGDCPYGSSCPSAYALTHSSLCLHQLLRHHVDMLQSRIA